MLVSKLVEINSHPIFKFMNFVLFNNIFLLDYFSKTIKKYKILLYFSDPLLKFQRLVLPSLENLGDIQSKVINKNTQKQIKCSKSVD